MPGSTFPRVAVAHGLTADDSGGDAAPAAVRVTSVVEALGRRSITAFPVTSRRRPKRLLGTA